MLVSAENDAGGIRNRGVSGLHRVPRTFYTISYIFVVFGICHMEWVEYFNTDD